MPVRPRRDGWTVEKQYVSPFVTANIREHSEAGSRARACRTVNIVNFRAPRRDRKARSRPVLPNLFPVPRAHLQL